MRYASSPAAISALLGTQPVHRQSPPGPRGSRSMRTTRAPRPAAVRDATSPAVPPPMTTRSYGFTVDARAMSGNLTDATQFAEGGTDGSTRPLTEGELWSRALLDRLRGERFTPGAWRRFFGDGFRRARVTRARRPALVAQSRAWGLAGAAAALPFGARAMG